MCPSFSYCQFDLKCRRQRAHGAFSLIEMLAATAVMGVLVALMVSGISGARNSALKTKDLQNLRTIGLALRSFANDNANRFPLKYNFITGTGVAKSWDIALLEGEYLTRESLKSPVDKVQRTVPGSLRSYKYNGYFADSKLEQSSTLEGNLLQITKPLSDIVLVGTGAGGGSVIGSAWGCAAYAHGDCSTIFDGKGSNYLFADMHAAWMKDTGGYADGDKTLWRKHWRCDQP